MVLLSSSLVVRERSVTEANLNHYGLGLKRLGLISVALRWPRSGLKGGSHIDADLDNYEP